MQTRTLTTLAGVRSRKAVSSALVLWFGIICLYPTTTQVVDARQSARPVTYRVTEGGVPISSPARLRLPASRECRDRTTSQPEVVARPSSSKILVVTTNHRGRAIDPVIVELPDYIFIMPGTPPPAC